MVNLMYCGNEKVFDGMLISALSTVKHTDSPITVYILTMDLSDIDPRYTPISAAQAGYIRRVLKDANPLSNVLLIDAAEPFRAEMLDSRNMATSYTPYTLLRLFADALPEIPEKIIYLDTDTVSHGDISLLYDIDISNYEFGAALDHLGRFFIRHDYMNAGVLLLNMERIRSTGLFARCRALCRTKKMSFPDQDAINRLGSEKLYLDRRFNSQRRLYDDTVIQHFSKSIRFFPFFHTVNVKPWEVQKVRQVLKIHEYDDILDDYLKRKEEIDAHGFAE